MIDNSEKIYFLPGDRVTLKQDIPNKPIMVVEKKATKLIKNDESQDSRSFLQGIICFWFTLDGHLEKASFNTKDLIHYDR